MQAGHEAYNRGEYSRAVSSWRGLYRCLEGEKSPVDTRQMVVELILSAYYAADLLGPEISRVDEALELIADYRRVLGAESPPSIVVVWEEKL